ncbi:MAG: ferritin-like domain-containing protein [Bryobacteraceae bacterium]
MQLHTPEDLFLHGLESIYDIEQQLTEELHTMAHASSSPQLRSAFEQHLSETKDHVARALELFKRLDRQPAAETNRVLQQMRQEIAELIQNTEPSPIRDAALVIAGNQVEHLEIACYGSLVALARVLGNEDEAYILEQVLDEEKKAAAKLTEVGECCVNIQAVHRSAAASTR